MSEPGVNRSRTGPKTAIVELIGRVANNDVKLHLFSKELGDARRDVIGVNERTGVALEPFPPVERPLACATVLANAVDALTHWLTVFISLDELGRTNPRVFDMRSGCAPPSLAELEQ